MIIMQWRDFLIENLYTGDVFSIEMLMEEIEHVVAEN